MGTPALSCSTDALSNAVTVNSDDEVDQSSMWVQEEEEEEKEEEEDHTSSDLPPDFLEPLSPATELVPPLPPFPTRLARHEQHKGTHETRQFWKSGDFTGSYEGASFATEGMDHARVHPKFLHSNATSHKWVLGAIAELLDNAVDEIRNGATFVKIDVQSNPRNGEPMLVIEDDGGGMDPDCMRRCMSLGYSAKSKLSNTIGQYGNGFKTSTMRLGADVIVFSRHQGSKPSESIGMMSYTFLTSTGQNDIVVPIVDFQMEAFGIRKLIRSSVDDWMESMGAIQDWSPYSSQAELVSQFRSMPRRQGTKVIIYNLWEDEEGRLELDFTADSHDIQIGATSRDDKTLKIVARFPSCKHYLTHRHSLRTYVSILYLRLPAKFRIFLRGTQVQHHTLRNEMMLVEQVTYRPKDAGRSKAVVTLGFVKDAENHIDISGFNVYHKNRLIKPFWRIWNPSDTRGRGIIAILEANFVEPAHDKQGFERTIVLTRLEARLMEMQKSYWNKHCHLIGYTNASLKKSVRSLPNDPNSPANDCMSTTPKNGVVGPPTHAGTRQLVIEKAVSGAHDDHVASDLSHGQGGSSVGMMQTIQEASFNFLRPKVEESNLMPAGIDSMVSGAGNSNGILLHRQDPGQVELSHIHTLQSMQDAPSTSAQRVFTDSRIQSMQDAPSTSAQRVFTDSRIQSTVISPADFNTHDSRPLHSTGMAPIVIDLDSPDTNQTCEDVAFDMPFSQGCDLQTKMITEMHLESGLLSGAGNACENSQRADDAAGLPKGNEAEELIDASVSFPPEGVKDLPEMVCCKSCKAEDSRGINQVEAGPKEHVIESYVQSHEVVTTVTEEDFAAPITIAKDGHQLELETLGKAVPQNGACSEAHPPTTIELDEFFDSLEIPSDSLPSIKDTGPFVQSPVSEIDPILPDIEENVTLEDGHEPLVSSIELQARNEGPASDVRSLEDIKEHENKNFAISQVSCEDIMKDCIKTRVPPETEANVLPDTDVIMIDVHEQESDDHLGPKQDIVNGQEKNVAAVVDQHLHKIMPQDATNFHDIEGSTQAIVEQQTHESMAIVPLDGASFYDKKDSLGRIQTSCLDIVSIPTMAMVEVVTGGIVDSPCGDLLEEDRLVMAKQQIDSLLQSIEAAVVEVDDLKEQVQQQRELQHVELRNLNVELARALSCLEELRG